MHEQAGQPTVQQVIQVFEDCVHNWNKYRYIDKEKNIYLYIIVDSEKWYASFALLSQFENRRQLCVCFDCQLFNQAGDPDVYSLLIQFLFD